MSRHADAYDLHLVFQDATLDQVVRELQVAVARPPWPAITSRKPPGNVVGWKHGEDIAVKAYVSDGEPVATISIFDTEPERAWRALKMLEEVVELLLERNEVIVDSAVVRRIPELGCLPNLPLIGTTTYVVVGEDEQLAWAFEDVEGMIEAGEWEARTIEGARLLSRAMHAGTDVELLEAIQDGQWAIARLARPGRTTYDLHEPDPELRDIFRDGDRTVRAAGYVEDDETAVYACTLDDDDDHVRPWEIFELWRALRDGKLASGEPVKAIQVVFTDEVTAMRERRPLMDIGVTVQHYDDDGELITLPKEH